MFVHTDSAFLDSNVLVFFICQGLSSFDAKPVKSLASGKVQTCFTESLKEGKMYEVV